MVRGKCTLGRGLEPFPEESVSVPLSEHIYLSVSTGRQLSLSHYFKLHLGKPLGGKLECLGRSFPPTPPSRLNPACCDNTITEPVCSLDAICSSSGMAVSQN